MLYPRGWDCSSFTPKFCRLHCCVWYVRVNCERVCPTTAPRLGESCDCVVYTCVRQRKLVGGSGLLEEAKDCRQDERPSQPL